MEAQNKSTADRSSVYLLAPVRHKAEIVSAEEGMTLNEFINAAVAEKLAHHEHVRWVKGIKPPTPERLAEARRLLRSAGPEPPEPGDELPEGFVWPEI
jgi:hypothetical protein